MSGIRKHFVHNFGTASFVQAENTYLKWSTAGLERLPVHSLSLVPYLMRSFGFRWSAFFVGVRLSSAPYAHAPL